MSEATTGDVQLVCEATANWGRGRSAARPCFVLRASRQQPRGYESGPGLPSADLTL